MDAWIIVVAICGVYLAASLIFGLLPGGRASRSTAGYVAGDRTLGLLVMYFITGATIFSAFAFLGGPGWAYSRGAAAFYILGYGAFGMIPFYFWGPRAARLGRVRGYVTQAEMVADRYDMPAISALMAIISVVAFVPYLALQVKGAGIVLEAVTEGRVSVAVGGALVYGVVLIYVLRSGVLGVGWTNTFQGLFMMALAWGLGLYLPKKLYGGVGAMFERLAVERPELLAVPGLDAGGQPWPWGEFSTAVLVSAIGFAAWPHLFMKAFTAKSEQVLRRTVVLYPTFQIFLVPLFFIGFAGVFFASKPEAADQILPHMLMHMEISPWVVGLFCAGALAASMSSGDAMAHAAASIAIRDGAVRGFGLALTDAAQTTAIRIVVVVVMVAAYVVGVAYQGSLVILLLSTYGAVVQFAPALWATLFWKRATGSGVLAGMGAGIVLTTLLIIFPQWRPWPIHPGMYGLIVNVLFLGGISLAGPSRTEHSEFLLAARATKTP